MPSFVQQILYSLLLGVALAGGWVGQCGASERNEWQERRTERIKRTELYYAVLVCGGWKEGRTGDEDDDAHKRPSGISFRGGHKSNED